MRWLEKTLHFSLCSFLVSASGTAAFRNGASAQPSPAADRAELPAMIATHGPGAEGCPSGEAIRARVGELLEPSSTPSLVERVQVAFEKRELGYGAVIELLGHREGSLGTREIQSDQASCEEIAHAAVLTVALLLDFSGPTATPTAPTFTVPSVAEGLDAPQRGSTEHGSPRPPFFLREPDDSPSRTAVPDEGFREGTLALDLTAGAVIGALPSVVSNFAFTVSLLKPAALELSFAMGPAVSVTLEGGTVEFRGLSAALRYCPLSVVAFDDRLAVNGCAGAGVTTILSASMGPFRSVDEGASFVEVALGASVRFRLVGPIFLVARLVSSLPAGAPDFVYRKGDRQIEIYSIFPVLLRFGVGFGVFF